MVCFLELGTHTASFCVLFFPASQNNEDVTPRNWEDFYRRFGGTRCLILKSALRMDAVYSSEGVLNLYQTT